MSTLFHPKGRRGMALFEVMIALTIFAMVAFSLVVALSGSMDAAQKRGEIDAALLGLQNQLALIHASPLIPVDKDLPDDGSGIGYHLTIETMAMQDQKSQPLTGMYRVTVRAKWTSLRQSEDRSLSELVYQP